MQGNRLFLTCLMAISAAAEGQTMSPNVEAEIVHVDRLIANPELKLLVIQSMAFELGTHRNHLIFLKKQGEDSFGQIYVQELRKRGLDDAAIIKKLRAIEHSFIDRPQTEQVTPGFTPIAYIGTAADHNSAGTFVSITPEVGINSRRFALVVGIPIYRITAVQREATGIGDLYASMFFRQPTGSFDIGAGLTIAAPTGNREKGLGAGRPSVDFNGTVQRRFESLRPFVNIGFTNSLFNNVGYQRPFISNGNSLYTSGGIDYKAHSRVKVGVGGFGLNAFGEQTVISQMTGTTQTSSTMPGMPPVHMPPGMGAGSMGSVATQASTVPFYGHGSQAVVPGADVSDYGFSAWASWSILPNLTLSVNAARSIPYELTTVRVGIGFDLSHFVSRRPNK